MILNILLIIFSYLLGSLSAAIIVCRIMGLSDPRASGSGNPGATNVLRLHGKKVGIVTLLGDLVKGIVPVLLARYAEAPDWVIAGCGISVFLGHLYPVFFQFKGGKGVATLLGVSIAMSWLLGLLIVITWLLIAKLSRYSSIAGMCSAILSPIYAYWLTPALPYVICLGLMALLLILRHRQNITNLMTGAEHKLGDRE